MDAAGWAFLGVIVGGVLTGTVQIGLEWIRIRSSRDLTEVERKRNHKAEVEAFQRQTLLELQLALRQWVQEEAKGHAIWVENLKATGAIGNLGADLDDLQRAYQWNAQNLAARVTNDALRESIDVLSALVLDIDQYALGTLTPSIRPEVSKFIEKSDAMKHQYRHVVDELGQLLRFYLTAPD